jgi:hypothetical protein
MVPSAIYRTVYADTVRWLEGIASPDLRDLLAAIGQCQAGVADAALSASVGPFCASAARMDACVDHALDLGYAPVRSPLLRGEP